MMRTWMASVGLMVCGLLVAGCTPASNATKKIEEGTKKAAGQAKESLEVIDVSQLLVRAIKLREGAAEPEPSGS